MKLIAKRVQEETYDIIAYDFKETIDGKQVEVEVGRIKQDKIQLEEVLKTYKEECKFFIEQDIKRLKEQQKKNKEDIENYLKAIYEAIEKEAV